MTEMSARAADIRVLGPVECGADRAAGPGGPKQRLLLALLVVHAGTVVSDEALLEAIWDEHRPADARRTLQVFVSRLRGALHPVGGTITWQDSGYVLAVPAERVDARRFERLVDQAGGADAVEDRGTRRALLQEALHLWRGRPFGVLGDHHALVAESERLTELRLRAAVDLVDIDLARGRHQAVVGDLLTLSSEHPLDESVCLRLALALHRCGRRPEALSVFEAMRRTLVEELGVDPSHALQQLHLLLLDDDPRLDTLVPGDLGRADHEALPQGPRRGLRRDPVKRQGQGSPAPSPQRAAVAVLPFAVLGGGDEADLLAAGLHAELLVELARLPELTVIGRVSVLAHAGTTRPLQTIAAELGVGTVVTGSVQVSGNRLGLTVELVDVSDGHHRWAESFRVALHARDLLNVQLKLAQDIADALSRKLVPQDPPITESMEVYRLVAEGRLHFDRKTEEGFARAVDIFRRAVHLDPDYPPCWVGLAESLALMADYAYGDREELLVAAEEAVGRCLATRPDTPGTHTALGLIAEARFDGPTALAEYTEAVRHVPGHADAHSWTAWISLTLGKVDVALSAARRAVELNPLSAEAVSNLGLALIAAGNPVSGHVEALRAQAISPGYTTAEYYAGLALHDQGRFAEAVGVLTPLATYARGGLSTPWAGHGPDVALALSLIAAGDVAAARQVLATIEEGEHPVEAGLVHLALEQHDRAGALFAQPVPAGYAAAMLFHLHFRDVWARLDGEARAALGERIAATWHDTTDRAAAAS